MCLKTSPYKKRPIKLATSLVSLSYIFKLQDCFVSNLFEWSKVSGYSTSSTVTAFISALSSISNDVILQKLSCAYFMHNLQLFFNKIFLLPIKKIYFFKLSNLCPSLISNSQNRHITVLIGHILQRRVQQKAIQQNSYKTVFLFAKQL